MKANSDGFFIMLFKKLEDIEQNLMKNSLDKSFWLQGKALHDQIQKHALEHEFYWAQYLHQIWTQLGDKKLKFKLR